MRKIRITSAVAILGAPNYLDVGFDISGEDGSFEVPDGTEMADYADGPALANTVMTLETTVRARVRGKACEVLNERASRIATEQRARALLEKHVCTFDLAGDSGE